MNNPVASRCDASRAAGDLKVEFFIVIPACLSGRQACRESFIKKDAEQVGMTEILSLKIWVRLSQIYMSTPATAAQQAKR